MATQFQQRCDAYDVYRERGVSLFRSLWYDHLALSISIAALFRIRQSESDASGSRSAYIRGNTGHSVTR